MAQRKGEDYVATRLRAPKKPLVIFPRTLSDTTAPAYGRGAVGELDDDLTRQHSGEPVGERIVVTGRVLDGDGRPVSNSLVEIWQANAAGRYTHHLDQLPDEEEANAVDPVLSSIEDRDLRRTLIARDEGGALRFDIHVQGDGQTAFFEFGR
jgi:protocatechuate 3,4-dioxygenase beta subunit